MKTIEQAAKEYADKEVTSDFTEYGNCVRGFHAGVEFSQRWISVKEEMPGYYNVVLIRRSIPDGTHRYYAAWLASMDDGSFTFTINGTNEIIDIEDVPYWRPIEHK